MYKKLIVILFSLTLFLTKPSLNIYAQDSSQFRFAVMGCTHLGICSFEEFESTIEKIKEYKPDFVLFLGGMIDPSSDKPLESLWHKFDGIIDKLGVPVYDVPGICRLSILSATDNKIALMEKCFLDRYKKLYYSFEHKDNLFIGLDSNNLNLGQGLGFENQLNFLKNTIANTSRYNNVFMFTHNSLWLDKDTPWDKVIHPLINGKVKFVFGAQKHILDANKIDDVTYITTGSPQCYLQMFPPKLSIFNFLIVEVVKDSVSIKIVPINPIPIENLGYLTDLRQAKERVLHGVLKPYLLTSYERGIFLTPDRVIETMEIKPGMDILDIGAGVGFFTFRFAEALKGEGKVFATDMDPNMIEYMKSKIKEVNYKNIFPILVSSQGVDAFYKQHSFDIIFLCEAYQYLRYPEDYFRELRPSLKKKGRLYIIHDKNIYDFTDIEIRDFSNLIKVLASKENDFPVFRKLDKDIQYFIRTFKTGTIPAAIKEKIINNLNKMLLDRWLLYDLMDYFTDKGMVAHEGEWSAPLKFILSTSLKRDIRLIKWLFVNLDIEGVFKKKEKPLSAQNKRQLHKLNKILLCGILGTSRIEELQGEYDIPIYVEKDSVIYSMEKAGYQFIREYDFLPIDYFLEFKRRF